MKRLALLVALIVAAAGIVRADAVDDAEAKKRGVAVEVVQLEKAQARIKELEAQVAALQKQQGEKSATANATRLPPDFEKKVDNYRPEAIKAAEAEVARLKELQAAAINGTISPEGSGLGIFSSTDARGVLHLTFQNSKIKTEAVKQAQEAVATAQKMLSGLKDKSITAYPPFAGQIAVGDIGIAPVLEVLKIQDNGDALVNVKPGSVTVAIPATPIAPLTSHYQGLGIVGYREVSLDTFKPAKIWIKGAEKGWTDGLKLGGVPLLITGTGKHDGATILEGELVK